MGVTVTFDYAAWLLLYPEFQNVSEAQATACFDMATLYCRNDGGGPVSSAAIQTQLLNMMTAHMAFLTYGTVGSGGASPLVGRISNAAQGSVNVATENNYPPGTAQWFQQTKYGAAFYAATAQYRRMYYRRSLYNLQGGGPWVYPNQ